VLVVLLDDLQTVALTATNTVQIKRRIIYLVTDVDDEGRLTMQNYHFAAFEGVEYPKNLLPNNENSFNVLLSKFLTMPQQLNLLVSQNVLSTQWGGMKIKPNFKDETFSVTEMIMKAARQAKAMPRTMFLRPNDVEDLNHDQIIIYFNGEDWTRQARTLRIDETFMPASEIEVDVDRSANNFINIYYQNEDDVEPKPFYYFGSYSLNVETGNLVRWDNKTTKPTDVTPPSVRSLKTWFVSDGVPSNSAIKSEITADSVYKVVQFDVKKTHIEINDLFNIYLGQSDEKLSGYIADICHTELKKTALFVQADSYIED
jgi:hypothetical protein